MGQRKGKEGGALVGKKAILPCPPCFSSPSSDGGKGKLIQAAPYYRSYQLQYKNGADRWVHEGWAGRHGGGKDLSNLELIITMVRKSTR